MIRIETLETPSLGDRSYLATDGQVAVIVDPQRDIDRLLTLVEQRGLRVTHVLETHVHNDYVSGGLELARCTGGDYVLPEGSDAAFDHLPVGDGELLHAGAITLRSLRTPGHTHSHTSCALQDADGRPGPCSPAAPCSTAPPAAPTWSAPPTPLQAEQQRRSVSHARGSQAG